MKALFSIFLIFLALSIGAQDTNWKKVIEDDNVRNFVGHLGSKSINACEKMGIAEYTFLSMAIKSDSKVLIDHILNQKDLDLSHVCSDKTILMYAIKYGDIDLVKTLIKNGADASQLSKQGKSALQYARKYEKKDVYDYLNTLDSSEK